MSLNMWRRWLRQLRSGPSSRDPRPAPRVSYRPRCEVLEDRSVPSTFTVTNTNNSGAGSLRQAILYANATAGADLISFNVGGGGVQTISPTSILPQVIDPVTIDGTTQPGFAGAPSSS